MQAHRPVLATSKAVAVTAAQTLTIKYNKDRLVLAISEQGTRTNLIVTVGDDGDPITITSTGSESIGKLLDGNFTITSKITITTDVDTTLNMLISHPDDISVA